MTRNITVYLERTQKKVYFEGVDINTLGELKTLLTENNIDYRDMDFNEGVSGVKLLNNESQLPHDLTFKGQRTNDLMILLTTTAKKTASGVDRSYLYNKIREYGLAEEIFDRYDRNFTNLSTGILIAIIDDYERENETIEQEEEKKCDCKCNAKTKSLNKDEIFLTTLKKIQDVCKAAAEVIEAAKDSGYSQEDIEDALDKI